MSAEQVYTGQGTYGPQTTAAVAKLQKDYLGLQPTTGAGYYGPQTKAALSQKYQNLHAYLKGKAAKGKAAPDQAGQAQQQIQDTTYQQSQVSSDPVFGAMASSLAPIMGALTQVLNNINNPVLTATSLQQEYNALSSQYNLPSMQADLMNMQNIMNGTEDDIRTEITKSGGFATESQVLGMSAARNKVIMKQYNALATNYAAAQQNVQNLMQYATSDQQTQLQRQQMTASITESMASIESQMMNMGMTMQQNAATNVNKIVTNVGYQGLAQQAQGNPQMLSYYEKLLILPPGSMSDPQALKQLETYRQQQLAQGQQKINITLGGSGLSYAVPTDPSNPAPNSGGSLLSAAGLSLQAFNYLTQGVSSMSRMTNVQRNQIMSEANSWLNSHGIDVSTFQSRYDAYNKVLQGNIQRTNAAQIQENELQGTITNLAQTISQSDLGSIKAENVAKLFAGQQVNDPTVTKYATQLLSLRNELAGYNAAVRGNISASGGPSPDQSDMEEAAQVIQNGIGSGSLAGFQSAITSQQQKMGTVLQGSVDSANKQVWDLFGVGNQYQSPVQQSAKGNLSDSDFVESTLTKLGKSYTSIISTIPPGKKGVILNSTGEIGVIDPSEYDPSVYTSL